MKPFVRINEVVLQRGAETTRPAIIGLTGVALVTSLKNGYSRIELTNGNKITVTQTVAELFEVLPLEDLYIDESKVEEPTQPEEGDEDDETAELVDPADVAAISSDAALKLADKKGINIEDVPPNDKGRIGKTEVQKYLESLNDEQ